MKKPYLFTALILGVFLFATPAWAVPIQFVSTAVNQDAGTVHWTIQFASVPDFFTVDEFGRQKDSFQFYAFDGPVIDPTTPYSNITSITRGEEIHFGQGIPIRETLSLGTPDPGSGGWGPVQERVPFTQQGELVSYMTSLDSIGDTNGDGRFGFNVLAISFGGSPEPPIGLSNGYYLPQFFSDCVSGTVCRNAPQAVPIPDMLIPTMLGMIGLAGLVACRRRREAASAP